MKSVHSSEKRPSHSRTVVSSIVTIGLVGAAGYYASKYVKHGGETSHAPFSVEKPFTSTPSTPEQIPTPSLAPSTSPAPTEINGCLPSPKQDLLKADIGKMIKKAVAAINAPHGEADASKVRHTEAGRSLIRHIGGATVVLNVNRPLDETQNEQVGSIGVGYSTSDVNDPAVSILARRATATSPSQIEVTGQAPSPYDNNDTIPVDNILCADGKIYNRDAGGFTMQAANPATVHKWTEDIALVFSNAEAPGGVRQSPALSDLSPALRS